jgi:hypothetical protein
VCIKHGAKVKLCRNEGCTNFAVKGGVCFRHAARDVDEMMEEYEGQETVLIGQLSAILATRQKRNNEGKDVDGGRSTSGWE